MAITTTFGYDVNLEKGTLWINLPDPLSTMDCEAHIFTVKVMEGEAAANIAGAKCTAWFVRADGVTVPLDGTVSGNKASITLGANCYAVAGRFRLSVKLEADGAIHTLLRVGGYVDVSRTDKMTSAGSGVQSFDELVKAAQSGGSMAPEYVVKEAMEVLDKVVAAQGNRTFTLGAITDMHYGSSDYTAGVLHATQGLKHIADRIKLDAIAVLGDYTDEHQMDTETAVTDLEEMNALLDPLRHNVNLRLKGNHDHRPGAAAQTYRYITAYSDGVVWGSRIGGYYFRDFDEYKLRIICLNTTETARDNLAVSYEQVNFFIRSLDLSSKADAAEWGILLLSHHPLDFTVSDGKYRFGPVINAYQNGTSWTDGTVACDYTGKNAAAIIGNIHGHLHNQLLSKMYIGMPGSSEQTNVFRLCTPASRVDYVNHYSPPWQESKWYGKTENTAEDTSFCVYCIDLDARTVKAFCYGAGYDVNFTYAAGAGGGGESSGDSGGDVPAMVNQIPISTDVNGNIYNGKGWKANARYSASSSTETEYDGVYLSGFIPVNQGDVVWLNNVGLTASGDSSRINVAVFGSDKTDCWEGINVAALQERYSAVLDAGTVTQFTVNENIKYIRINATYLGDDSVVTIQSGGSGGGDDSGGGDSGGSGGDSGDSGSGDSGGEVVASLVVDADGKATLIGATLTVDAEGNAWIGGADVSGDGSGNVTIE